MSLMEICHCGEHETCAVCRNNGPMRVMEDAKPMSDLLTPAELAAIGTAALQKSNEWRESPEDSFHGWEENTTQLEDAIETLLRHIAALEARMPAPATDVDALLAEAEKKVKHARAKLSALCHGRETFTMRIPADRTYDHDFAFADALDACNDLATALRESRAREVAEESARVEAEREFGEMRNNILKAADDIDLWRSRAKRETDLRLKYEEETNRVRAERDAAIARAEKAEAEAKEWESAASAEEDAKLELIADLAAARAELGALGEVEYIREAGRSFGARNFIETVSDDPRCVAIRRVLKGGAQ